MMLYMDVIVFHDYDEIYVMWLHHLIISVDVDLLMWALSHLAGTTC